MKLAGRNDSILMTSWSSQAQGLQAVLQVSFSIMTAVILGFIFGLTPAFAVGEKPYAGGSHEGEYLQFVDQQRKSLKDQGFQNWTWNESENRTCLNCQLFILPANTQVESQSVYEFLRALEEEKPALLKMYAADPNEYNFLAHLSVGILGRESLFFRAKRYFFKEYFQPGVNFLKLMRKYMGFTKGVSARNSRGPTQIKDIPQKISEHYQVTPDTLYIPKNAAVATMGYLIEALKDLKYISSHESFRHIQRNTYVDYLPYIYFGSRRSLLAKTATPDQNLYIKDMKKYMKFVELYERPLPIR